MSLKDPVEVAAVKRDLSFSVEPSSQHGFKAVRERERVSVHHLTMKEEQEQEGGGDEKASVRTG